MALPDADRRQVWAHFMRAGTGPDGVTKPDLRAAVDAIDAWVDANQASFNAAIPQPARNNLTAVQKSLLLMFVVMRRQGMLRVDGD